MLLGGVLGCRRVVKPHWLGISVGGAFRLGYLLHCSIVGNVFSSWPGRAEQLLHPCTFTLGSFVSKMSFSCNQSMDGSFPPSPAEDRGSKRLSWGNLLQRLAELKGVNQRLTADQCSRSETGSVADMSMSESESSVFCHPLEETLATEVVETIALSLSDMSHHALGWSKLILPDCLLQNIGKELLHLAVSEPCGLRGALIDLCVEQGDQGSLCSVDQIAVDASLVPTFHVTLVLRPEAGGLWPKVQKLFKSNKSPQMQSATARHQHTLRLSSSFRAIKRKLYCSGELLIEECC